MDESWDADFEGQIRIPEQVRVASDSVKSETSAARELSRVTAQLRAILLANPHISHSLLISAMSLVQASTQNINDAIYQSKAWELCKSEKLELAGDSIEEVLRSAKTVLNIIQANIKSNR